MFIAPLLRRTAVLAVLIVLFLPCASPTEAGAATPPTGDDPQYPVSEIDPLTRASAHAVVRLDDRHLTIKDAAEATYAVRRVVTVLTPEGRDEAFQSVRYGEFREIEAFDGVLRDADGNEIRDMEDSDRKDVSASDGSGSLATDARYRYAQLTHSTYPYTVELEYKVDFNGYFTLPTWYPQSDPGVPVVEAQFRVTMPPGFIVRHEVRNADMEAESLAEDDGWTTRRWRMTDVPATSRLPYYAGWRHRAPALHLAPSRFSMAGRKGTLYSWEGFGTWLYELWSGRQQLPPDLERKVDAIAAEASSERELTRRLYAFMQERTRYISVQLGIGGWQPFTAAHVHDRGYGDCKALTNYLWAMLQHAGIEAYPATIYLDRNPPPLLDDFPSNQFNHVVLAVPTEQDTLWLEATSQTMPFAHVHSSIEDRMALLIKPDGGELVKLPASSADDNRQVRNARVDLRPTGRAHVRLRTLRTGAQTDQQRLRLTDATPKQVNEWAKRTIAAATVDVTSTDVSQIGTRRHEVTTTVEADLPQFASTMGNRLFVPVNLSRFSPSVPPPLDAERTLPMHVSPYPWADVDSTTFVLPDGYTLEALPDSAAIDNEAGTFHAQLTDNGDGTVTYVRRIRYASDVLPPSAYDAFRTLTQAIAQADRQQMVLVKP